MIASFKDELLCPVACLRVYEKATAKFREDEAAMQLFLSIVPPHRLVSSSIIARWIKKSLERAGLEPTFSTHLTRSAASIAAALSGLSTQEVMDRAGWSSLDTFCRYYFRPQSEFCTAKRFGDAVLGYKYVLPSHPTWGWLSCNDNATAIPNCPQLASFVVQHTKKDN